MFPPVRKYIDSRLAKMDSGDPFGLYAVMWETSQMGETRKVMRDKIESGEVDHFRTPSGAIIPDMWRKV